MSVIIARLPVFHEAGMKLLMAICLSLAVAPAIAKFKPCNGGATLLHINGINTLPWEAALNMAAIRRAAEEYSVGCVAKVDLLYNPTSGLGDDIYESALQLANQYNISKSAALLNIGLAFSGASYPLQELLPGIREDARVKFVASIVNSSNVEYRFVAADGRVITTGELVSTFTDGVVKKLRAGEKTILIAHSQGNFFANAIYLNIKRLEPLRYTGLSVVNIANVANSAPSDLYISSNSDLIVKGVSSAMKSNYPLSASAFDYLGHNFQRIYMNSLLPEGSLKLNSIGAATSDLIRKALEKAQFPAGVAYASSNTNLIVFDLARFQISRSQPFTFVGTPAADVYDIAYDSATRDMFAIGADGVYKSSSYNEAQFTVAFTKLPASSSGGVGLAIDPAGRLLAMRLNRLYYVDRVTGAESTLMSTGEFNCSGDMTFDAGGAMFASVKDALGKSSLLKVDVSAKSFKRLGDIGFDNVWGLYFYSNELYGTMSNGGILKLNVETGVGQYIGQVASFVSGLQ